MSESNASFDSTTDAPPLKRGPASDAGIDSEVASLRHMCDELTHQLEDVDQQILERQQLTRSMASRVTSVHEEADLWRRRSSDIRTCTANMRNDIADWDAAGVLYQEVASITSRLNRAQHQITEMQQLIDAVPQNVHRSRQRAHAAINDVNQFLSKYILSLTFSALSAYGGAEQRLSSAHISEVVVPQLADLTTSREKRMYELCSDVDYRTEESLRLESSVKTITEQCLTDSIDVETSKHQEFVKIQAAFDEERQALLRAKSRLESEMQEIEFHAKRGTFAKGSTKMTSTDILLHDKVTAQQDEMKVMLSSFDALRNEKLQLEREAESSLQKLMKSRDEQAKSKSLVKSKLDELRAFHGKLSEEKVEWVQLKREMQEMIVQQQSKVRTTAVEAIVR